VEHFSQDGEQLRLAILTRNEKTREKRENAFALEMRFLARFLCALDPQD